jgi:hypothetical protein
MKTSFHPSSFIPHPCVWSGRRDSNSRGEFGRLECFQLHHSRSRLAIAKCRLQIGVVSLPVKLCWIWTKIKTSRPISNVFGAPGRIRTRSFDVRSVALFQLSYRSVNELEHRTGFEPVSRRRQRHVLSRLDQRCRTNFEFRNSDFGFIRGAYPDRRLGQIRNPKSGIRNFAGRGGQN